MGPEVQTFFPELKLGLRCRRLWKFDVRDRAQGQFLNRTVIKPF